MFISYSLPCCCLMSAIFWPHYLLTIIEYDWGVILYMTKLNIPPSVTDWQNNAGKYHFVYLTWKPISKFHSSIDYLSLRLGWVGRKWVIINASVPQGSHGRPNSFLSSLPIDFTDCTNSMVIFKSFSYNSKSDTAYGGPCQNMTMTHIVLTVRYKIGRTAICHELR